MSLLEPLWGPFTASCLIPAYYFKCFILSPLRKLSESIPSFFTLQYTEQTNHLQCSVDVGIQRPWENIRFTLLYKLGTTTRKKRLKNSNCCMVVLSRFNICYLLVFIISLNWEKAFAPSLSFSTIPTVCTLFLGKQHLHHHSVCQQFWLYELYFLHSLSSRSWRTQPLCCKGHAQFVKQSLGGIRKVWKLK